jgi:hypothetical protein
MGQQLQYLHALVGSLEKGELRFLQMATANLIRSGGQTDQLLQTLRTASAEEDLEEMLAENDLNRNLNSLVPRLRNTLLNTLRTQHGDKTVESTLNRELEAIAILYRKKLWKQAFWHLGKGKRKAHKYSYLYLLGQLLQWERKLVLALFPEDSTRRLQAIREEEQELIGLLNQQTALRHLDYLARNLIRKRFRLRPGKEMEEFRTIHADPAVEPGLQSPDFLTFVYASNVRGLYLNATQDYDSAAALYRKAFAEWKENPGWIHEQPLLFTSIFNNFQIALMYAYDDTQELEECLLFIRQFPLRNPAEQLVFQNLSYQSSVVLYLNQLRFAEGKHLFEEVNVWLARNRDHLADSVHLNFRHNGMLIYFLSDDVVSAYNVLRDILNYPGSSARKDIREYARLMECVLLYEREEHDLNAYQIQNVYHYYRRRGITDFEQKTLSLLRALSALPPEKGRMPLFQSYLHSLDKLVKDTGQQPFGFLELRVWADARSREISIREAFADMVAKARAAS